MNTESFNIEIPTNREHYEYLANEIGRQIQLADNLGLDTIAEYYRRKMTIFHKVNYSVLDGFLLNESESLGVD